MGSIEKHVMSYGYRLVLFRRKAVTGDFITNNYLIEGNKLFEAEMVFLGKRLNYIKNGKVASYNDIQKNIRLVFDQNGVLIARRASPKAPLRLTGKGMGRLVATTK